MRVTRVKAMDSRVVVGKSDRMVQSHPSVIQFACQPELTSSKMEKLTSTGMCIDRSIKSGERIGKCFDCMLKVEKQTDHVDGHMDRDREGNNTRRMSVMRQIVED